MDFNAQNFGQVLKHLREEHGLSMLSLGKEIGTSASRIKSWENGESVPSVKWIVALSALLDVPLDILLKTDKEEKLPTYKAAPERFSFEKWEDIMKSMTLQDKGSALNKEKNGYIEKIEELLPFLSAQDLLEIHTLVELKVRKSI